MEQKQHVDISAERERQRSQREGKDYKPPNERALESLSRIQDEKLVDPAKDYYAILEIDSCASFSEVKQAYKRLALFYHPDKHTHDVIDGGGGESQEKEIFEKKFREISQAFDVLSNECQRLLYDKCRDYMHANPGRGLPVLSPEEQSRLIAEGAAELRKLRRMAGAKLGKHPPLHKDVAISLENLNSGCTKILYVDRCRVDYAGKPFTSKKAFHLIIRRGSKQGDCIVFEGEGHETVDLEAGNAIFTLQQKPHRVFRRIGNDLEVFAGAVPTEHKIIHYVEVASLKKKKALIVMHVLREALERNGIGGVYRKKVDGVLGLNPHHSDVNGKPGDVFVSVRYPPVLLTSPSHYQATAIMKFAPCIQPEHVYMLGSTVHAVPAVMIGGMIARELKHRMEYQTMVDGDEHDCNKKMNAVFLSIGVKCHEDDGPCHVQEHSTACKSLSRVLRHHIPGLRSTMMVHWLDITTPYADADDDDDDDDDTMVLDDIFEALYKADIIYFETQQSCLSDDNDNSTEHREQILNNVVRKLESAGMMHVLFQNFWQGCHIIAAGTACSLLGVHHPPCRHHAMLPWYSIRVYGGAQHGGWDDALSAYQNISKQHGCTVVGLLPCSAYCINAMTGCAEMVVAPCKEALIESAAYKRRDEIDDDSTYGFFVSIC